MAGSRNKATFRHIGFIRLFTRQLLFRQSICKLLGTILYTTFKQGFVFTECSNVRKSRNKSTTFNRVASHLNHSTVFTDTFKFMCTADFHPANTLTYVLFNRTRAAFTTFRVITNQICNRTTDIDQIFWIIEQN